MFLRFFVMCYLLFVGILPRLSIRYSSSKPPVYVTSFDTKRGLLCLLERGLCNISFLVQTESQNEEGSRKGEKNEGYCF
jgi:hypothetical protein